MITKTKIYVGKVGNLPARTAMATWGVRDGRVTPTRYLDEIRAVGGAKAWLDTAEFLAEKGAPIPIEAQAMLRWHKGSFDGHPLRSDADLTWASRDHIKAAPTVKPGKWELTLRLHDRVKTEVKGWVEQALDRGLYREGSSKWVGSTTTVAVCVEPPSCTPLVEGLAGDVWHPKHKWKARSLHVSVITTARSWGVVRRAKCQIVSGCLVIGAGPADGVRGAKAGDLVAFCARQGAGLGICTRKALIRRDGSGSEWRRVKWL